MSDQCCESTFLNGDTLKESFHCVFSYRDAETEAFTERHKPGFLSTTSSNVSFSTTRPPLAPTPTVPPVLSTVFDPGQSRGDSPQKPQLGSGNLGESLMYILIKDFCQLIDSVCIMCLSRSSTFSCPHCYLI